MLRYRKDTYPKKGSFKMLILLEKQFFKILHDVQD